MDLNTSVQRRYHIILKRAYNLFYDTSNNAEGERAPTAFASR